MDRNATQRSSRQTNSPGSSPSMMRVKTEAMGWIVADLPWASHERTRHAGEDRILTVPNVITLVRLLCLPVFLGCCSARRTGSAAAGLLAVLGATDWVDGYIARHFDQVSNLGKILDPVADRLLFFVGIVAILIDGAGPAVVLRIAVAGAGGAWSPSPPSSWRPSGPRASTSPGSARPARSPDVRLPAVPWPAPATTRCRPRLTLAAWWLRHPRAGPRLLRRWPCTSPSASQALRERRGPPGREVRRGAVAGDEGRDHGGRRGHPTAAPDLQRSQADAAAGQPADDGAHHRPAASATASTRSSSPSPSWPTPSATTSATAPSSACSIVVRHRGDAARHRRVGAQRHGRPRRALPRHLRRRPHRHRPRRDRRLPRGERGAGHHRPGPRREPARVRHRHHPRGRLASSASSRSPRWGQVFTDTINTGIFVLEPEIFDYIAADRPVDFSSEVFPALLGGGPAPLRRRRRRLLGGRRHPRGLRQGPQGHPRRQGRGRHPRLRGVRRGVGGRGRRDPPRRRHRGPGRDRRQLPGRGRRPPRRVHRARRQRAGPRRGRPRAHRRARQRLPRRGGAAARAPSSAGPATCASGVRCEEGVGHRRRVLHRRGRASSAPA